MAINMAGLTGSFQGAKDSQKIKELQGTIEQLETQLAEAEQLRQEVGQLRSTRAGTLSDSEKLALEGQITALTEQLAHSGGEHSIDIALIDADLDQPRTVFAKSVIQERAASLRDNGQLAPIIVIPQANGRYKLFEGQLRWEAAKFLAWPSLRSVFLPETEHQDPLEIFTQQVVTSAHSKGLHELDLATAILRIVSERGQRQGLALSAADVPKILNTAMSRLKREKALPDFNTLRISEAAEKAAWIDSRDLRSDAEREVYRAILNLQLHPGSVNNNVMPLLKLSDDLKQVIRQESLEGSKARELNKLAADKLGISAGKALKVRIEVTQQVVEQKLSLSETRILVEETLRQHRGTPEKSSAGQRAIKQINQINLDEISADDLLELQEVMQQKLTYLTSLIR
jgi:ParB family transcriptional regulator, chromosome partitioning protein